MTLVSPEAQGFRSTRIRTACPDLSQGLLPLSSPSSQASPASSASAWREARPSASACCWLCSRPWGVRHEARKSPCPPTKARRLWPWGQRTPASRAPSYRQGQAARYRQEVPALNASPRMMEECPDSWRGSTASPWLGYAFDVPGSSGI